MSVERLNYFRYQFLQENDFQDEQGYHLSMRRRHNRDFHTFGRVRGLDLIFVPGERHVTISPGTAVDSLGREIVVESNTDVDLQAFAGKTVYLVLAYKEDLTHPPVQAGVAGNFTRTTESFQTNVYWVTTPNWDTSLELVLGKITLNAMPPDGAVTNIDFSERIEAGAKIGQADLPALRFTVPTHGGADWPEMHGTHLTAPGSGVQGINVDAAVTDFSGSVTVHRNVTVAGDLTVQGVVNKTNDLEVKDNIIRVNKYEPPTATPAPVDGGLEVYRGGTAPNAQIIWDETADRWKVGVVGTLDLVARIPDVDARFDPTTGHKHTGVAGDGPALSHANLTNIAGADPTSSDLVLNKHISNAQGKKWQDHVNIIAGNPHGTTAAGVGALAATDYGFTNSFAAQVGFNQTQANGAASTIATTFRPKFLWVTGAVNAFLGAQWYGSGFSAYADLRGATFIQRSSGADIWRLVAIPYWNTVARADFNVAGAAFFDLTVTPNRREYLTVTVSAITNTSLTLTLGRQVLSTATVSYAALANFSIVLNVLCFG
jgi:hypothetical protein